LRKVSNTRKLYLSKREKKRLLKKYYIALKKKSVCSRCGENRWYVLTFHHNNGTKKDKVSNLNCFESIEELQEEIDKCIVLCANCHLEIHHLETIDKKQS